MNDKNKKHATLSYEAIVRALFERYESIYVIDAETSVYECFHESDSYSSLCLEEKGEDFFQTMNDNILRTIYEKDQEYVRKKMSKEALTEGLSKEKYYSFVYRLMIDGQPKYHKLRATQDLVGGRKHFLVGIRDVDRAFRQDKTQAEELDSMYSKETNHLEAILASAEGYLETNLSQDIILETSANLVPSRLPEGVPFPTAEEKKTYSSFEKWRLDNLVVENKERFRKISDRKYLIRCFNNGEKRASVSFSIKNADGQIQLCRKVFYLYQNKSSDDVMSFCVLYDLTEQQKKDKELRDLEKELQFCRLHNFTSRMQPHFLYNALGSIQEIILDDPQYASNLIGDFTMHLRSCIRAMANDGPIPFEQEFDNIKAYVNIEKMRFGDKLKVIYKTDFRDFKVLPLSIQPVVENAIRHGIYERGETGGCVTVQTVKDTDGVKIVVQDDGVGFDVEKVFGNDASKTDSTGLKNIMFRLDKMMHAKVDIESEVGVGTTVTITIPEVKANEGDNSR